MYTHRGNRFGAEIDKQTRPHTQEATDNINIHTDTQKSRTHEPHKNKRKQHK